ncbi:2-phosphosulfolactate phosphatase [Neobacillus ginsengisoli]|uniref:Probable 2-phosphosulfolactate phosphatase n=1 Tax=Neobacillus ginsengisoli TaxID=904295 RepID=A0ABT9XW30_9BACI|nr:2-phosphosulfolactate phosphatase [Neobacillus ginsengisoli]MDQ0199719.1 2-phosphosulfolactate phosphatase [Neobacillus ginsengisoli]
MNEMKFEVAFMPKEIKTTQLQVCVLVDVLRATSAIVTMFEKGCTEIVLTDDEEKTINERIDYVHDGTLVCAEDHDGKISPHAQLSPSLSSIRSVGITGKRVVMRTTNGTLAGLTLWNSGIKEILIGSLHNAKAVMEKAVSKAKELNGSVTIVCAGRENGQIAALDDAYCAGVLLRYGEKAAKAQNLVPLLKDSAKISHHLLSVYSNTLLAFEDSGSGETMRRINCREDIKLSTEENISRCVPEIYFSKEDGLKVKNSNEVISK